MCACACVCMCIMCSIARIHDLILPNLPNFSHTPFSSGNFIKFYKLLYGRWHIKIKLLINCLRFYC